MEGSHFIEVLGAEIEKMKKERSFQDASVWEKVFQSLKEFEDSGLEIPQLKVTIGEFVRILKEENKKSFVLVQGYQARNQVIDLLKDLRTTGDELQIAQKQYKQESNVGEQLSEGAIDKFHEQKRQIRKMESDLEVMAAKCEDYFRRCLSINIDEKKLEGKTLRELLRETPKNEQIEQYLSLGEKQVIDEIKRLEDEIVEKRGEQSGLCIFIAKYEKELHDMEKVEPHKFEAYLDQLNELHRKTTTISSRILSEYNTNLSNLMNDKREAKDESARNENKRKYYDEVSKYLAHRLGSFRHIDKIYKAKIVDLISGAIVADNDEVILLTDMGTGQTQSAYILSMLNINSKNDPRKIIALFDEIAMMDDNSLEPICSRMKELYEENRLLLGIYRSKE